MKDKFLILGSNSFAGSSLTSKLLDLNNKVIGISRSNEPDNCLLGYSENSLKNQFSFYKLDLNDDFQEICNIIDQEKPSYIVDFAGQGMVAESWIWPEQWYNTNIVSKVKLHNFLKDKTFLKKYIRVSTPEVYGSCNDLIKENQRFNPSTPYAVSHASIDLSLKAFYDNYDFPVIFTRFANFYGPYQQCYRIIPKTILFSLLNLDLPLHGGGKSIRSFIYHEDVSDGILKCIEKGKIGETYHFSTEEFVSIYDLVTMICDKLEIDKNKVIKIVDDRPGKDQSYLMDIGKARNNLNWVPKNNLKTGIEKTIIWVKNNFDVLKGLQNEYIHKI